MDHKEHNKAQSALSNDFFVFLREPFVYVVFRIKC